MAGREGNNKRKRRKKQETAACPYCQKANATLQHISHCQSSNGLGDTSAARGRNIQDNQGCSVDNTNNDSPVMDDDNSGFIVMQEDDDAIPGSSNAIPESFNSVLPPKFVILEPPEDLGNSTDEDDQDDEETSAGENIPAEDDLSTATSKFSPIVKEANTSFPGLEEDEDGNPFSTIPINPMDTEAASTNDEQFMQQQENIMEEFERRGSKNIVNEQFSWSRPDDEANLSSDIQVLLRKYPSIGYAVDVPQNTKPPDIFTNQELAMIRLMDYCDFNSGNSRTFLDGLLKIVAEEMISRDFDPHLAPSRQSVAEKVVQHFNKGNEPSVAYVVVSSEYTPILTENAEEAAALNRKNKKKQLHPYKGAVPGKEVDNRYWETVSCIAFKFQAQFTDLLEDGRIFHNINNLVVNQNDPFAVYENQDGRLDEILDGTWYPSSVSRLRSHPVTPFVDGIDFLVPLVLYCDKTGTSINQRHPLEPFLFTLGIIRRSVRNNPAAWRALGFIPDLEAKSSAEKAFIRSKNTGYTTQTYHLCLEYILKGIQEVQERGIVHWLRLGDVAKCVRLRPEVAFIINDGKSADMITGRVPSHHCERRISRACKTKQKHCDLTIGHNCTFIQPDEQLLENFRLVGMNHRQLLDSEVN